MSNEKPILDIPLIEPPALNTAAPLGRPTTSYAAVVDSLPGLVGKAAAKAGHDAGVAYLLSMVSAWAYAVPDEFEAVLRQKLPERVRAVHSLFLTNVGLLVQAAAYLVVIDVPPIGNMPPKSYAILAFRGTVWAEMLSWLIDVGAQPRQFKDLGYVHNGIYQNVVWNYDFICDRLHESLASEMSQLASVDAILVTGHSLGGAMAALTTAMLWNDDARPLLRDAFQAKLGGLYTFGAPMVGDPAFADDCEDKFGKLTFMHVFGRDIVPRMFPRSMGLYQHFGKSFHSAEMGWVLGTRPQPTYTVVLPNIVAGSTLVMDLFPLTHGIHPFFSWTDHFMRNYMRCSEMAKNGSSVG